MARIVRPLRSVGNECFALSRSLRAHVYIRQNSSEKKGGEVFDANTDWSIFCIAASAPTGDGSAPRQLCIAVHISPLECFSIEPQFVTAS